MNKRNKIFLGMALAAAMLPMAACTDDVPQTIRLEVATETAGAKMTLGSDRYTYFEEGDIVKINNQPYALASDGSGGYHWADVQFPQEGNCFTAFFPTSLQAQDLDDFTGDVDLANGRVGRNIRMKLPRVYNYNPATGKIDIPMVALAKLNSTRLRFKHMCAVIGLTIDNQATGQVGNIGRVRIDSVRFSINGGTRDLLSGEYSIRIFEDGGILEGMSAQSTAANANSGFKRVSVHLPASSYMENQLTIPVPIPPVASGKTLTVTLYGWNHLTTSTSSSMRQFTYSADFTLTRAITRNQYVSATATLNGEGMNFFMFIDDNGIEDHNNNGNLW